MSHTNFQPALPYLRELVRWANNQPEHLVQNLSLVRLHNLHQAAMQSEWSYPLERWSTEQRVQAERHGLPPRFRDDGTPEDSDRLCVETRERLARLWEASNDLDDDDGAVTALEALRHELRRLGVRADD
jgi:hypothetical protein